MLGIPASNILGKGGKVEYLLSLEDPSTPGIRKTIALPFVNVFRADSRPAVQIRHTLGRAPVIEHTGTKKVIFTIQGRSGQHFFLGANKDGNLKFASGVDLFQELQRFLLKFEEISSSSFLKRSGQQLNSEVSFSGFTASKPFSNGHLLFMAPFENYAYYVQPTAFNVSRSAQTSRHSYEFSLTLEATAEYKAPPSPISGFEKAIQAVEKVTEAIDTAAGAVAFARANVDIFQNDLRRLLSPIDALQRVVSETESLVQTGSSTLAILGTQTNKLLAVVGQAIRVSYDAIDTISFNALEKATDQGLNDVLRGLTKARTAISVAFGKGALAYNEESNEPKGSAAEVVTSETSTVAAALVAKSNDPVVLPSANQNFTYEKILEGETLIQFALRLGVPAAAVAELNEMINFTIGGFSVPLTGGMVLKVPLDTPVKVKPGDKDLFGTDLEIDLSTGDLVFNGTNPQDFSLISGPKNLKQGTTLRLLTVTGENHVFPSMGLPVRAGDASTTELVGSLAFDVRSQLLADRRIEEVTSLFLEDQGDTLALSIEAQAKKDTSVQFSVPLQ